MENSVTLVVLHGFCGDNLFSIKAANEIVSSAKLSSVIKTYTPDLPAHGFEPKINVSTLADYANFLHEKLSKLNTKYIIIGFSMGGAIALKYSELYKDEPNLLGIGVWASPVFDFNKSTSKRVNTYQWTLMKHFPVALFNKLKMIPALVKWARTIDINLQVIDLPGFLSIANAMKATTFFINTTTPMCFVYDSHDPVVTLYNYESLKKLTNTNLDINLIEHGGHFGNKQGVMKATTKFGEFIGKLIG